MAQVYGGQQEQGLRLIRQSPGRIRVFGISKHVGAITL